MAEVKRKDEIQGDILHEYDGIEEADNRLPNWWLGILYGTTLFGIGYWFAHHEYGMAETQNAVYARHEAAVAEAKKNVDTSGLAKLEGDTVAAASGAETFKTSCVPCHGVNAEGTIGPNLTDDFWIHGGTAADVHRLITDGVAAKGMPAWGAILGAKKVEELTAYVLSLRGKNAKGKAPQGDAYTP